jgi:hypothetical protein
MTARRLQAKYRFPIRLFLRERVLEVGQVRVEEAADYD